MFLTNIGTISKIGNCVAFRNMNMAFGKKSTKGIFQGHYSRPCIVSLHKFAATQKLKLLALLSSKPRSSSLVGSTSPPMS